MQACKGQRLGILTFLLATLTVYWASALSVRLPRHESTLLWGNQETGMIAAEIVGDVTGEGIYFVPRGMKMQELPILSGVARSIDKGGMENEISSYGSALTITISNGVLKVTDMPAAKRLALGLPVDLNIASEEELSLIPGIGNKTAIKIAVLREKKRGFQLLEDLLEVPGIGRKKLNDLKKYLTLGKYH